MRRQTKGNTALWVGNPDEDNTFASDKNAAAYKLRTKRRTVTIVLDNAITMFNSVQIRESKR